MFYLEIYPKVFLLVFIYQGINIYCEQNKNISKSIEGFQYTIYFDIKSWNNAKEYCKATGGQLVSIPSANENEIITDLSQRLEEDEEIWIGAERSSMPQWSWVDGHIVKNIWEDFLTYTAGMTVKRHECGYIKIEKQSGGVIDPFKIVVRDEEPCSKPMGYFCQNKSCNGCPPDIHNENRTWNTAKTECENNGKMLAVYHEFEGTDTSLYDVLKNISQVSINGLQVGKFWIGIQHHEWKWVNGGFITYANKSELRKEDDEGNNCLSINKAGNWKPNNCSSEKKFMCKMSESVSTIKTPLSTTENFQLVSTTDNSEVDLENNYESSSDTDGIKDGDSSSKGNDKGSSEFNESKNDILSWINMNIGMVAGVVAGAVVLLILIIVFVSILLCKKKQQNKIQQPIPLASNPNGTTTLTNMYTTSINPPVIATSTSSRPPAEGAEGPVYSEPDMNKKKRRESENVMVENDLYST